MAEGVYGGGTLGTQNARAYAHLAENTGCVVTFAPGSSIDQLQVFKRVKRITTSSTDRRTAVAD